MPARPELKDARKRIKNIVDGEIDDPKVKKFIQDAMEITKRAQHQFVCKKCRHPQTHWVDIQDHYGAMKVWELLLNQGSGRPKEAEESSGVTVNYRVEIVAEPSEDFGD